MTRQVYRSKDFPLGLARQEFTTLASMLLIINTTHLTHVVVDSITYEGMRRHFEEIQNFTVLATPRQREEGFICKIWNAFVFTDAFLPQDRQWVNVENVRKGGRSQFIVVHSSLVKPYDLPQSQSQIHIS